jgi:hypothetical protein
VYSLAWSVRPDHPLRFAVGSFLEASKNKVPTLHCTAPVRVHFSRSVGAGACGGRRTQVMILQQHASGSGGTVGDFAKRAEVEHSFPPTKIAWVPDRSGKLPDLLATVGDYLRLWEVVHGTAINLRGTLTNQVRHTATHGHTSRSPVCAAPAGQA